MIISFNIQEHFYIIEKLLKKRKIVINESKSSHLTFPLQNPLCPAVNITQTVITQTEVVKFLGLQFDCGFNCKEHNAKKKKNRYKNLRQNGCQEKKSHSFVEHKSLIYKVVNKLIWSYGIELWGCETNSNKVITQSSKSKFLCTIKNAPRYETNHILNTKFNIP